MGRSRSFHLVVFVIAVFILMVKESMCVVFQVLSISTPIIYQLSLKKTTECVVNTVDPQ